MVFALFWFLFNLLFQCWPFVTGVVNINTLLLTKVPHFPESSILGYTFSIFSTDVLCHACECHGSATQNSFSMPTILAAHYSPPSTPGSLAINSLPIPHSVLFCPGVAGIVLQGALGGLALFRWPAGPTVSINPLTVRDGNMCDTPEG